MADIGFPVTGNLYVHSSPFDHVSVATSEEATAAYWRGETVVVPTLEIARRVLLNIGLDETTIEQRIRFTRSRLRGQGIMHL